MIDETIFEIQVEEMRYENSIIEACIDQDEKKATNLVKEYIEFRKINNI